MDVLSFKFISAQARNNHTILPWLLFVGKVKLFKAAWEAIPEEVRCLLFKAESKIDALNSINLGNIRTYTVGEAVLWASFGGVSYASQVAKVVSGEAPTTRFVSRIASLFKDAKAISFGHITPISINKFLLSPVFGPRPRRRALRPPPPRRRRRRRMPPLSSRNSRRRRPSTTQSSGTTRAPGTVLGGRRPTTPCARA